MYKIWHRNTTTVVNGDGYLKRDLVYLISLIETLFFKLKNYEH